MYFARTIIEHRLHGNGKNKGKFNVCLLGTHFAFQDWQMKIDCKTCLVTGATGFTGGVLIRHLGTLLGNDRLIGTGRNPTKLAALATEGFHVEQGDLADADFRPASFQTVDALVHCAALSSPWGPRELFWRENVLATTRLLDQLPACRRVVYISTPSVYVDFRDRLNVREDEALPKRFVNAYAASKFEAEHVVLARRQTHRVVLRPRAIIGPGDTTLFPRLLRAHQAGRLRRIGDGRTLSDFVSVRNVAHAVALALASNRSDTDGEVFNLTNGEPQLLWPLIERTLAEVGSTEPLRAIPYGIAQAVATATELVHKTFKLPEPTLTRYGVSALYHSMTLDISKARDRLGYAPQESTAQTLDAFLDWFRQEETKRKPSNQSEANKELVHV